MSWPNDISRKKRGGHLELQSEDKGKSISSDEARHLVAFRIGPEEFGIDISEVKEIIRVDFITRVPNTPEYVEGVLNLRGKIIVIVNLAKRIGLPVKERDEETRILVIESEEQVVGVVVDSSNDVIKIPSSKIEEAPKIITDKVNAEYIKNVGILDERLIIMLDLQSLLFNRAEPGKT